MNPEQIKILQDLRKSIERNRDPILIAVRGGRDPRGSTAMLSMIDGWLRSIDRVLSDKRSKPMTLSKQKLTKAAARANKSKRKGWRVLRGNRTIRGPYHNMETALAMREEISNGTTEDLAVAYQ